MSTATYLEPRIHRLLANPLRHELFVRTGERPWSITELAERTGEPVRRIKDAVRELREEGLIELVAKRPGPKGGLVHLYRAARVTIGAEEWAELSVPAQAASTTNIVRILHGEVTRALAAETLYAHKHHVMMRDRRVVDDAGMHEIEAIMKRAHEEIAEAEGKSTARLAGSPGAGIPISLGFMSFPVAPEDQGSAELDS